MERSGEELKMQLPSWWTAEVSVSDDCHAVTNVSVSDDWHATAVTNDFVSDDWHAATANTYAAETARLRA